MNDDELRQELRKLAFLFMTCGLQCADWVIVTSLKRSPEFIVEGFNHHGTLHDFPRNIHVFKRDSVDAYRSLANVVDNYLGSLIETTDGDVIIVSSEDIVTCIGPMGTALSHSLFFPNRVTRVINNRV